MTIRQPVATITAALLAASGLLAGCSNNDSDDDPPDSGLPSKSELSTSTPTPTEPTPTQPSPTGPTEPPLPTAAKASGKQGAKAFIAYYIRLLNLAQHTGFTEPLREFGPDCRSCTAFASLAESIYGKGGWMRGGTWTQVPTSWFVLRSGDGFLVGLNIDVNASRQLPRRGGDVVRYRGERIGRDFRVVHDGQMWKVKSMKEPS